MAARTQLRLDGLREQRTMRWRLNIVRLAPPVATLMPDPSVLTPGPLLVVWCRSMSVPEAQSPEGTSRKAQRPAPGPAHAGGRDCPMAGTPSDSESDLR